MAIVELVIAESAKSAFKVITDIVENWLKPTDRFRKSAYRIVECMDELDINIAKLIDVIDKRPDLGRDVILGTSDEGIGVSFINTKSEFRDIVQSIQMTIINLEIHFKIIKLQYSVY